MNEMDIISRQWLIYEVICEYRKHFVMRQKYMSVLYSSLDSWVSTIAEKSRSVPYCSEMLLRTRANVIRHRE